jgi:iron complex outermembrane receptor protein
MSRVGSAVVALLVIPFASLATQADENSTTLDTIVITATPGNIVSSAGDSGYVQPNATTATKTDTPLMETPVSVQVVPQQILQDQKVTTLDRALNNMSGVRSSNTGWEENIYLRGFSTSTYFRDGFRIDDPSGLGGLLTLSNVDSIEVLKGPGSILYGRVEPGGVINLITKQPLAESYYSIEQRAGSWDHYITNLDATGPIDENKHLLYRANLSYETGNSWVDNVTDTRVFIAPTLQWKPDAKTQITFETSYSHDQATLYQQSVVPYDTTTHQFQWGPRSANPAPYYFDPNTLFMGLNWSHQINDNWTIKQMISRNQVDFSTPLNLSTAFGPMTQVGSTWMIGLGTAQLSGNTRSDGTVVDLTGHFETGMLKHTLLLGADYYRLSAYYNSKYSNPNGPFQDVPLFSSTVISTDFVGLDPDTFYVTDTTTTSSGVYLQDQIKLPDNIDILAGLRYQDVSSKGTTTAGINMGGTGTPTTNTPEHDDAITPRVGVVWQARNWLSLYTSYTENFGASNATQTDWQGKSLKPEGADQYELGAKTEFLDSKANFSVALFDLTKNNVVANDLAHPNGMGGFFPTSIGKIESKGVELTLQGEIASGWGVLAAYTYDHAFVKVGTATYEEGSDVPFVPREMFRFFSTYKLTQASLAGWKVGGGITWQGSAPGVYLDPVTYVSDTKTISSPAYAIYDAMAAYDFRIGKQKATFQINVDNLFNKSYYTDAFMYVEPWGYVTYGAPRSIMSSLKVEF